MLHQNNDDVEAPRTGPQVRGTAERLLRRVRRHRPGDRLETIAAMAGRFKVSLATMHKAVSLLSRQGWLSSSRGAGTFVAAGPKRRTGPLGLRTALPIDAFSEAEFYREFLLGLCATALSLGMDVRLLPGEEQEGLDPEDWEDLCGLVALDLIDAAPLLPLVEQLPVVMLETTVTPPQISGVSVDFIPAIREAIQYLFGLGHRRFGFVGFSSLRRGSALRCPRYEAFVKTVESLGGEYDLQWSMDARHVPHAGRAIERLVSAPPSHRPTAVITRNMAWPVLCEMARRGLVPGKDLSVVSLSHVEPWPRWLQSSRRLGDRMPWQFGPSDWLAGLPGGLDSLRHVVPTSVTSDAFALGDAAASEVQRRRTSRDAPPQQIMVGAVFSVGNTTGAPPT
jgi:DNA-binding LacI/PurR family transcriptional regulator